jgi:hypothetical protein
MRCVHCLKEISDFTWDHILPKGWYPNTTPQNIEKWKVPSCKKCNNEYSKIEDELLIKFGLCIDPHNPRAAGITHKALRALKPIYAKNPKDAKLREDKLKKIFGEAKYGKDVPEKGIYPNFEFKGTNESDKVGLLIRKSYLKKFTEKIVKGIIYLEDKKYVEDPYYIQFYVHNRESIQYLLEKIHPGPWDLFARGPGMGVLRAVAVEDNMSGIYLIDIWGQLYLVAMVLNKRDIK